MGTFQQLRAFLALLQVSVPETLGWSQEMGVWGADGLQDRVSQTGMHTGAPLSLPLWLCATWVQPGPLIILFGRLSLPLGSC